MMYSSEKGQKVKATNFLDLFEESKPIIAMLHLKGTTEEDMLERAKREIAIYYENGIDAVLVENYFGDADDCEIVLSYLQENYNHKIYGVNILGDYVKAFKLADKYGAKFIQIDSVCGHLPKETDYEYGLTINELRAKSKAFVLGGVCFKYQPVFSGRSLEQDLKLGMERCDAVVVTGDSTGHDSPNKKIAQFREIIGDFPLIVGAGVTVETLCEKLPFTDGVIVGSWLKEDHRDNGDVSAEYVREFMSEVRHTRIFLPEQVDQELIHWVNGDYDHQYSHFWGQRTDRPKFEENNSYDGVNTPAVSFCTVDPIYAINRVFYINLDYFKEEEPIIGYWSSCTPPFTNNRFLLGLKPYKFLEYSISDLHKKIICLYKVDRKTVIENTVRFTIDAEKDFTVELYHYISDNDIKIFYELDY